jgi:rubrerythrin
MRNAIEAELAAARFYDALVGKAADDETRRFFQEMAEQEREHAAVIEEMSQKIGTGELPTHADTAVDVVETVPGWGDATNIEIDEALELALEAENSAVLYYDAFSDFGDEAVRAFFQRMSKYEEAHAESLRKLIAKRAGR